MMNPFYNSYYKQNLTSSEALLMDQELHLREMAEMVTRGRKYSVELYYNNQLLPDGTIEDAKALVREMLDSGWDGKNDVPNCLKTRLTGTIRSYTISKIWKLNDSLNIRVNSEIRLWARYSWMTINSWAVLKVQDEGVEGVRRLEELSMAKVLNCLRKIGDADKRAKNVLKLEIPDIIKADLKKRL